ncbi:hypothetical protein Plhal304r1_c001g0000851 [Plasmopara halstedii]
MCVCIFSMLQGRQGSESNIRCIMTGLNLYGSQLGYTRRILWKLGKLPFCHYQTPFNVAPRYSKWKILPSFKVC